MAKVISTEYDSYHVDFNRLAVALTLHPDVLTLDIAKGLGIHPVMLYRWRMEMRNGDLPRKAEIDDIEVEIDELLCWARQVNRRNR